jgi:hypothetical protein
MLYDRLSILCDILGFGSGNDGVLGWACDEDIMENID